MKDGILHESHVVKGKTEAEEPVTYEIDGDYLVQVGTEWYSSGT